MKGIITRLEEEKKKIQAECDAVTLTKISLEQQLNSKNEEAELQEKELVGELEEVSSIFYR